MDPKRIDPADIARAMGLTEAAAWHFATNIDKAFRPTRRVLVKGKVREIDAPYPQAKRLLKRLHKWWIKSFHAHPMAHGGVVGRSYFTSARIHTGNAFIVTRDIKDCYPSIKRDKLYRAFRRFGFRPAAAKLLTRILAVRGRVPQGSPVSSDALNIYLFQADLEVSAVCGRYHATRSRNYDDIVVSFKNRCLIGPISRAIESSVQKCHLTVSQHKRRKHGVQSCSQIQKVHGLVVNSRRGVAINKEQAAKATSLAEDYVRGAKRVSPESLPGLAAKRAQVCGWMYNCRQAEFSPAKHVQRLIESGDRIVRRKLERHNVFARHGKWWVTAYGANRAVLHNEPERLKKWWRKTLANRHVLTP